MSANKKQSAFGVAFLCVMWPFVAFVAGYFVPFFVGSVMSLDYTTQMNIAMTGAYGLSILIWLVTYTWSMIVKKSRPGDSGFLQAISVCFSLTAAVVFVTYISVVSNNLLVNFALPILIIIMVFSLITDVFSMAWLWRTKAGKMVFVMEVIIIYVISFILIRPQSGHLEKFFGL